MATSSKYPYSQTTERIMQTPTSQFPSKFGTLPGIRGSPVPHEKNQMVPISGPSFDSDTEERVRQLETRINVTEKSNRALLEEVVRLQSELKATVRRSEDMVREEKQTRQQLEHSLRSSNDLIAQLSSRLKRNEDKLMEERQAVSALVNHTKSVEQAVLGSQQELMNRRDLQTQKLQEMQNELEETTRAKDQLERLTFTLVDEMRQIKAKQETTTMEFGAIASDLKNRSKRLEEDNRQTLDTVRKHGDIQTTSENTTSQLRQQIESRLSELRDVLIDLRNKQETETQERRMLEQQMQKKISDLNTGLAEQSRKREEALHALDSIQREREHAAETERIKLQGKIAETAEEVSKKILQKEIRLREEAQDKFNTIEKYIHNEQSARMAFEKEMRKESNVKFDAMRQVGDEKVQAMKDQLKLERSKTNDTLNKLDEAVDLLQDQMEGYKKQNDKIMSAEIKSRKAHERDTMERVEDLQEKLSIATSTLQAAVGGIMAKLTTETDKLKKEMKKLAEDEGQKSTRTLADLDTRVTTLNSKIGTVEDRLEAKISASSAVQAQNVREKVESMATWQEVTGQTLRDLQHTVRQMPEDVAKVEEKMELLKSDTNAKVNSEAESRMRDIENIKRDMSRLAEATLSGANTNSRNPVAKKSDFDACQDSLNKLAESVQTIKAVLGMKIATEQKVRENTIATLERQVDQLRAHVYRWQFEANLSGNGNYGQSHSPPPGYGGTHRKQPYEPSWNQQPSNTHTPYQGYKYTPRGNYSPPRSPQQQPQYGRFTPESQNGQNTPEIVPPHNPPKTPSLGQQTPGRDPPTPNRDPQSPPKDPSQDPQTPNRDPQTPNRDPQTPNRDPQTPNRDPQTPNRDPQTPNRDPRSPTQDPQTPNGDPQTPNREPKTTNSNPETPNRDPQTPNKTPAPENATPTPQSKPTSGKNNKPASSKSQQKQPGGQEQKPNTPKAGSPTPSQTGTGAQW